MTHNDLLNQARYEALVRAIRHLAVLLQIAQERRPPHSQLAPNQVCHLALFPTFRWDLIGADVIEADRLGPTEVAWGGRIFVRRLPVRLYTWSIWYSRQLEGRDSRGRLRFERLITFRTDGRDPAPLPPHLMEELRHVHTRRD